MLEIKIYQENIWSDNVNISANQRRIVEISGFHPCLGSSISIWGPNLNHLNQIKAKLRNFTKYFIEINNEKFYFELTNTAPSRLMVINRTNPCEHQESGTKAITSYLVDNIGYEKYISSGNYHMSKTYIISIFAHDNDKLFTRTKFAYLPKNLQIKSQLLGSVPLRNLILGLLHILYDTKKEYVDLKNILYNIYSSNGKITFSLTSSPDLEREKILPGIIQGKSIGVCDICRKQIESVIEFDDSFLEISLLRFFQEYFYNNHRLQNYGNKEECYHLSHSEIQRFIKIESLFLIWSK